MTKPFRKQRFRFYRPAAMGAWWGVRETDGWIRVGFGRHGRLAIRGRGMRPTVSPERQIAEQYMARLNKFDADATLAHLVDAARLALGSGMVEGFEQSSFRSVDLVGDLDRLELIALISHAAYSIAAREIAEMPVEGEQPMWPRQEPWT